MHVSLSPSLSHTCIIPSVLWMCLWYFPKATQLHVCATLLMLMLLLLLLCDCNKPACVKSIIPHQRHCCYCHVIIHSTQIFNKHTTNTQTQQTHLHVHACTHERGIAEWQPASSSFLVMGCVHKSNTFRTFSLHKVIVLQQWASIMLLLHQTCSQ